MVRTLLLIGLLTLLICLFKMFYSIFIEDYYLPCKTNDTFRLVYDYDFTVYMAISAGIFIIVYFFKQGIQLQQEQELTI